MTLVDIAVAAVRTRSGSTRILGRSGTMAARIPTTSSVRSAGVFAGTNRRDKSLLFFSVCVVIIVGSAMLGRVVNMAVSSLINRSCNEVSSGTERIQ